MKLVNMASEPESRPGPAYPTSMEQPRYPYGLSITLDTEALEKLGLKDDLPEVGSTLKLTAMVDVTSVSEHENVGGTPQCNVTLQITDLGLTETESRASADKLYKKA